jgi:succinate dehydrogenase / fumarate reductase membrane anchor subunit
MATVEHPSQLPTPESARRPLPVAWTWLLQRVSGVLLILLVGGHLWVEHFQQPGQLIRYQGVLARLQQGLFQVLDLGLLVVVVFHGLNGLVNVVSERWPAFSRAASLLGLVVGTATVLWGADILWVFWYRHPFLEL